METILWYDLETFGKDKAYDRIAQIAWIRTDMDYNVISSNVLYCKVPDYYLPNPEACLINHFTPQFVNQHGLSELDFAEKIRKEFTEPNTMVIGFNNLIFDDKFIRSLFYRTLFNPYSHEKRNTRWDILNLAKATHDLRPEGICWPPKDAKEGFPVFKLTELTKANNINQEGAHDALLDVKATIEVAKLIKTKQNKLYDYYFNMRTKTQINKYLSTHKHDVFLLTQYFNNAYWKISTHPILTIAEELDENGEIKTLYGYDLLCGPANSIEEAIENKALIKVELSKCPFIAPFATLPENPTFLGYTKQEILQTYNEILKTGAFNNFSCLNKNDLFHIDNVNEKPSFELCCFRETGFPKDVFYSVLDNWKRKLKKAEFTKERPTVTEHPHYNNLSLMFLYDNLPEYLTAEERFKVKDERIKLLSGEGLNKKAMTVANYLATFEYPEVQEKIVPGTSEQILENLREHYEYCTRISV